MNAYTQRPQRAVTIRFEPVGLRDSTETQLARCTGCRALRKNQWVLGSIKAALGESKPHSVSLRQCVNKRIAALVTFCKFFIFVKVFNFIFAINFFKFETQEKLEDFFKNGEQMPSKLSFGLGGFGQQADQHGTDCLLPVFGYGIYYMTF